MTLSALLSRAPVSEIAILLGGPQPVRGRGPAWWRAGKSRTSVSYDDKAGRWYDFGRAEGGGALDLICKVRGCDRGAAVRWLAAELGVDLDSAAPAVDAAEAERRRATRMVARRLCALWTAGLEHALEREKRTALQRRQWRAWQTAARKLWLLKGAPDTKLLEWSHQARRRDPREWAGLVEWARRDLQFSEGLTARIVDFMTEAERHQARPAVRMVA